MFHVGNLLTVDKSTIGTISISIFQIKTIEIYHLDSLIEKKIVDIVASDLEFCSRTIYHLLYTGVPHMAMT
jgi:hypothetical protein